MYSTRTSINAPLGSASRLALMTPSRPHSLLRSLAQEPLSAFALVAAALFAVNALLQPDESRMLIIDNTEIEARLFLDELNSGETPSAEAVAGITRAYIEEQVLVAEALSRGLDNDSRLHSLLAQKMLHILSAEIAQPSAAELQAFYRDNAARYERAATFRLEEVVFGRDAELSSPQAFAQALAAQPDKVRALPVLSARDLASIFSTEFANEVLAASSNWTGPFTSNRGQHWLRVTESLPAGVPPFDDIVEGVRRDWMTAEEERLQKVKVDELVASYRIVRQGDVE